MAVSKPQKKEILKKLKEVIAGAKAIVFTDYKGLTVADITKLRKASKLENSTVTVAKKTLIQKALEEAKIEGVDVKNMQGQVSLISSETDEIAPAKLAAKVAKEKETFAILGGILNGTIMDAASIKSLAKLPSKQELLGQVVRTINAPISGFVNVLAGNLKGLITILKGLSEKK